MSTTSDKPRQFILERLFGSWWVDMTICLLVLVICLGLYWLEP
jgi:hypothetical protein